MSKVIPDWTESKFWSFIRSALRSAANKYPVKWEVLKESKRPYGGADKRTKWEYRCALCKKWKKGSDVSVDHIIPAGSLNNYNDLVPFVQRLFVSKDGLQVLCSVCHGAKTSQEREATKIAKQGSADVHSSSN